MTVYLIEEVTDINARREPTKIEAVDIQAAKRFAVKNQAFEGTYLNIYLESGVLVASRGLSKKWSDSKQV